MTTSELYQLLELPQEVVARLNAYAHSDLSWLTADMKSRYLTRATADAGLEAIRVHLGDDPDGFASLWLSLEMARETWDGYLQRGIPQDIFCGTMKFVTRFLRTSLEQHGAYTFYWSGWFWRQLSMVEYRIGCLEYELVENPDGSREVSLHIPSDADMSPASVDASFQAFRAFLAEYYPDWQDTEWICDSWMMSPALEHLLPETSNVLAFNRRFETVHVNEDSLGVLDWVFPPCKEVSPTLPENTSLQRKMKAWLLSGNKVGWTKARLRK